MTYPVGSRPQAKTRVIAYVDGFNLYYGLKNASIDSDRKWVGYGGDPTKCLGRSLYWLDLRAVISQRLQATDELVAIKYFSAPRGVPKLVPVADPSEYIKSNDRQSVYWDALRASGVEVIPGKYLEKSPYECDCGRRSPRWEEKMTDVNVALHMALDACNDKIDHAILMSADSDFVPAVLAVKGMGKRVTVMLWPGRKRANEIQKVADSTTELQIADLRGKRLPNPIDRSCAGLPDLSCPSAWEEPRGWCWEANAPVAYVLKALGRKP